MIQAVYSGISGMKVFKSSLDIIGNNVANVNTTAYKASRGTFKEMLSQTIMGASAPSGTTGGSNPSQIGLGVILGSVATDQSQGSMLPTGRATDVAIEGSGFFALGDGTRTSYTRDGSFALDANNNLVSASTGLKVLGWTADKFTSQIDTTQPISAGSAIEIPLGGLSVARATSAISISGNLDASMAVGDQAPVRFAIYDSLGLTHELRVVFSKSNTPAQWDYQVYCDDAGAAPVAAGSIPFDSKGYSTVQTIPLSMTFANTNGSVQPLEATINVEKISQLNGKTTADLSYQDGLPLGTLESFDIDRSGIVTGTFTNGSTRPLGQIALAEFTNPAGLSKGGNNLLVESPNSGVPRIGAAGTGGLGKVASRFLEASNVDLASEFANMITAQRGFQANSRIITVSDEVLQELVSLKR